jgi:hypothetical protein
MAPLLLLSLVGVIIETDSHLNKCGYVDASDDFFCQYSSPTVSSNN